MKAICGSDGEVVFAEEWTVFAPLEYDDPLLPRRVLEGAPEAIDVAGRTITARRVRPVRCQYDFASLLGDWPDFLKKTAWVFLPIKAAAPTRVTIGLGWDHWLGAWLNGESVLPGPDTETSLFPVAADNYLIDVDLREGRNILAVRFCAGSGTARLAIAGPEALCRGDLRPIVGDPLMQDPAWTQTALPASPQGKSPVEIGDRRELFLDDFLIDGLSGHAVRRLHHPTPREVVAQFGDRGMPWEGSTVYHALIRKDDRILLYYSGRPVPAPDEGEDQYTCLMESSDGIHFTRPELGLYEYQGSAKNNIVWRGKSSHNFTPFLDPNPAEPPERRFKAIGYHAEGGALGVFVSPDGVHWQPLAPERKVITDGKFDSQNLAFWDELRGVYVDYHRHIQRGRTTPKMLRAIKTCRSTDFVHWDEPRFIEYADRHEYHMYTNGIRPYARAPHIYIGLPARFMEARRKIPSHPEAGVSDALLMSSRDGLHFERWNEGFIRPTAEPEVWTDRNQYPAWGLLELTPGEISLYWSEHNRHPGMRLRRGTIRADGFVSVHAGGEGVGEMLTRPLVFSGARLEINYATSAAGAMLFELCTEDGTPLEGFSLADSDVIYGNELSHTVRWRSREGELARWAGLPVRLRVRLSDADLFSFRFV